jgi:hypothetical protein
MNFANAFFFQLLTVLVVSEAEVVSDGVSEVGGEDVRLKDVNVDAEADGLPGADCAHGRDCRAAVVKTLALKYQI